MTHPTTRRLTRTAGAAITACVAVAAAAAPAHAVTWRTLSQIDDAKIQVCKVSVDGGDAWRVRVRVVNDNDFRVRGSGFVLRNGNETDRRWNSGWVRGGNKAGGAVRLPRGSAWTLGHTLGADGFGGGGENTAASIPRC